MSILSLIIINKSGGLVYHKASWDFADIPRLDLNDSLRLASIWHSLNAISAQLSPAYGCSGIELLEADTFDLHCFQTLTGTKFILIAEPATPFVPALLQRIYEVYADYVLKNPFYEMEQPIKCEKFDQAVQLLSGSLA